MGGHLDALLFALHRLPIFLQLEVVLGTPENVGSIEVSTCSPKYSAFLAMKPQNSLIIIKYN